MIGVRWWPGLPCALLAACGSGSDEGVGGVSASEARALNEAAAMLDARADQTRTGEAGLNPAAMAAARADRGRIAPANVATP
ncbi:MAG: hypothetical protein ABW164_06805 [Sphingobium sp.]